MVVVRGSKRKLKDGCLGAEGLRLATIRPLGREADFQARSRGEPGPPTRRSGTSWTRRPRHVQTASGPPLGAPRPVAGGVRANGSLANDIPDLSSSSRTDDPAPPWGGRAHPANCRESRRPLRSNEGRREVTEDDPESPRHHRVRVAPGRPLGLGPENVAEKAKPPRSPRHRVKAPSLEEVRDVIEGAEAVTQDGTTSDVGRTDRNAARRALRSALVRRGL